MVGAVPIEPCSHLGFLSCGRRSHASFEGQTLATREETCFYRSWREAAGGTSVWIIRRHVPAQYHACVVAAQFSVTVSFCHHNVGKASVFSALASLRQRPMWGSMVRSGSSTSIAVNPFDEPRSQRGHRPDRGLASICWGRLGRMKLRRGFPTTPAPILEGGRPQGRFRAWLSHHSLRSMAYPSRSVRGEDNSPLWAMSGSGQNRTTGLALMGLVEA